MKVELTKMLQVCNLVFAMYIMVLVCLLDSFCQLPIRWIVVIMTLQCDPPRSPLQFTLETSRTHNRSPESITMEKNSAWKRIPPG